MTKLEKVYHSLVRFLTPLTPEETYRYTIEEALKLAGAEVGSIFLANEKNELYRVYASSRKEELIAPRLNGNTYKAFTSKHALVAGIRSLHPSLIDQGFKSIIIVPLSYSDRCIGTINLLSKRNRHLSLTKIHILELFGTMVSLRARNAQLLEQKTQALKARDLFTTMAAHELKTPLTTLTVFAQLIEKKLKSGQDIDPKWAKIVTEEAHQLRHLINELLHLEAIKTDEVQLRLKPVDLSQIIRQAVTSFTVAFPTHCVNLNVKPKNIKPFILGDREKLIQVFNNLLSNAGKFSPNNSTVNVDLSTSAKNAITTIADHGHGIPKKDILKIFNRYQRGSNVTKEGMGLGLYITKNIIENHAGNIDINSIQNQGTTVQVTLPVKLIDYA